MSPSPEHLLSPESLSTPQPKSEMSERLSASEFYPSRESLEPDFVRQVEVRSASPLHRAESDSDDAAAVCECKSNDGCKISTSDASFII